MKKTMLIIVAWTVLVCESVMGDIVLSRKFPSCGYAGAQIYCYGGDTSATEERSVDTKLYSLNISQYFGQPTDVMNDKWKVVEPSAPFNLETRRLPNAIVLSDSKRFLLQGGTSTARDKIVNQTIIYDTFTNTWESALSYSEADRGTRQLYLAAVVNLPNNLVGFYGGFERLANISVPQISASGSIMPYQSSNNRSSVGFTDMKTYSPEANSWQSFNPQINIPENYYPNSQTATLDPASGKVYFLGGSFYTPDNSTLEKRAAFSWAYTFDTKSGTWLNETFGGVIPASRDYHTAHLRKMRGYDIFIAVLAVAAAVFYCVRRERQSKEYEAQHDHLPEQIHVDWDKIDDQYREIPVNSSNVAEPSPSANSLDASTLQTQRTPEVIESIAIKDNTTISYQQQMQFDTTVPDAVAVIIKPSVTISAVKPSVALSDGAFKGYTVVKPDVT